MNSHPLVMHEPPGQYKVGTKIRARITIATAIFLFFVRFDS